MSIKTSILIIEDNLGDAKLIQTYLKDASVKEEVIHAKTLFDGVDAMKNHPISLVLLDLTLPDSTGFKTLSNFLEKVLKFLSLS